MEVVLPEDYIGSIVQENDIISQINDAFYSIESSIAEKNDALKFETHITDFEEYEINLFFSENKTKATIKIEDDIINISINDKIIRIDADGNIRS